MGFLKLPLKNLSYNLKLIQEPRAGKAEPGEDPPFDRSELRWQLVWGETAQTLQKPCLPHVGNRRMIGVQVPANGNPG
jgi:hypothetical protein